MFLYFRNLVLIMKNKKIMPQIIGDKRIYEDQTLTGISFVSFELIL